MNHQDTSSFLLYRARDSVEGALLKAMLEENGIQAWTSGGQAAIGFGELGSDALLVDIRVRTKDALEARRLIVAFWRDRGAAGSGPWRCPMCGEPNETGFEACWSCGGERPMRSASPRESERPGLEVESGPEGRRGELHTVRVWLGITFASVLALGCTAIAQIVDPHLAPFLDESGSGEDGLPGAAFLVVFLVLWLPATVLIARWVVAPSRSARAR